MATHRNEVDRTRGPMISQLFEWYASGTCSLQALTARPHAAGLTHPQSGRCTVEGPDISVEPLRTQPSPECLHGRGFPAIGCRYVTSDI